MKITVIFLNKETQTEETNTINVDKQDIACLYRDQLGTFVSLKSGKSYKVQETIIELEDMICQLA